MFNPTRQSGRLACLAATVTMVAGSVALLHGSPPATQQTGVPKQLLVNIYVTDKKNVPVTDVTLAELEVKENGQTRTIQSAELDQRPLAVALILDNNSELSTSFMQSVVPAGIAAIRALPAGTTIDFWTTGDRPTQVTKAANVADAEAALKGVAAIGTNTLLHTIAEASQALPTDEGHRTAVIVMTSGSLGDPGGFGVDQALKATSNRPMFVSLELVVGQPDARVENMLEAVAGASGGYFDRVLSVTALEKRAQALVALINARYRLVWEPSGDPRQTKFDFKCTRKGTKVIAAPRISAVL
jgi:hypothetical protein